MHTARKIIAVYEAGISERKRLVCTYEDGKHGELFTYYPDQRNILKFYEFIGLTRKEAIELGKKRLSGGNFPQDS